MNILWTRSNLPLSKLICKVTNEPVSHVALSYHGIIIHADFLGVRFSEESSFRSSHEVVFEMKIEGENNETKILELLKKYHGRRYDFGALLFLGFSLLLRHYCKIPLPKSNLWQSSGMFICTEWVSRFVGEKADSMITPYGLFLRLRQAATN